MLRNPLTTHREIAIPTLLLEQIERGNVLLFVGEGMVRDDDGVPVSKRLRNALSARLEDSGVERSFPEIAQDFEQSYGRAALIQLIRDQLETLGDEPHEAHRLIAGLTSCTTLVTTALNRRLERAFSEVGRRFHVMVSNHDVPFQDERNATIYRLRGALDQPETLVLTTRDHYRFFRERDRISATLQAHLAQKTLLFVGYDLSDPYFQRLYDEAIAPLDSFARQSYAFSETPRRVRLWCQSYGIQVLNISTTDFLYELAGSLERRTGLAPASSVRPITRMSSTPTPMHPYKQLNYYE